MNNKWVKYKYTIAYPWERGVEYTAPSNGAVLIRGLNGTVSPFNFIINGYEIFYNPKEGNHRFANPPIYICKGDKYKLTGGTPLSGENAKKSFLFFPQINE